MNVKQEKFLVDDCKLANTSRIKFRELKRQIKADWRAHGGDWTRPGFQAIATHRIGVWRMGLRQPLRAPLSFLYAWAYRWCRNVYGIEIPYTAFIGSDVVIEHQGGIVIHGAAVIGDRCIIRQNCTLGIRSLNRLQDAPVLKDDVQVGAGAALLGKITIGTGAIIGANAVVVTDVPERAIAVGIPAIIRLQAMPNDISS